MTKSAPVETPACFLLTEAGDVDYCFVAGPGRTSVIELGSCSVVGGIRRSHWQRWRDRSCRCNDFFQEIGETPSGFVQFFANNACRPIGVNDTARDDLFLRNPNRNVTILIKLRVDLGEF